MAASNIGWISLSWLLYFPSNIIWHASTIRCLLLTTFHRGIQQYMLLQLSPLDLAVMKNSGDNTVSCQHQTKSRPACDIPAKAALYWKANHCSSSINNL